MHLIEVVDKQDYNTFVAAQNSGSFLQSWEWGEWNKSLGRHVYRYWILDNANNKCASIQLIKMPLPFGKYYLYAPYGPVIDKNLEFRIENLELFRRQFPGAVFIRVEPKEILNFKFEILNFVKSINIQPAISNVLDISGGQEQLLAAMHHKTRYNIRLAQKHGVEVQDEFAITPGNGLYSKEAVELILQTQARQKYRGHSESYYKNMVDFFALHNSTNDLKLHIYKALYQRRILASGIFIDFGKTRMYLYGGSSDEDRNVMAPHELHWRAICDAKAAGISFYDFGGSEVSGGGERGFTRFKRGFNGKVETYAGAYDFVFNKPLYKFYSILRKINKLKNKISPM